MRVRWAPSAGRELVAILDYIRDRSPQGALKVRNRIVEIERLLRRFPLHGRPVRNDPSIRRISTLPYPYVIFYEVQLDHVVIRRVRHAARNPDIGI